MLFYLLLKTSLQRNKLEILSLYANNTNLKNEVITLVSSFVTNDNYLVSEILTKIAKNKELLSIFINKAIANGNSEILFNNLSNISEALDQNDLQLIIDKINTNNPSVLANTLVFFIKQNQEFAKQLVDKAIANKNGNQLLQAISSTRPIFELITSQFPWNSNYINEIINQVESVSINNVIPIIEEWLKTGQNLNEIDIASLASKFPALYPNGLVFLIKLDKLKLAQELIDNLLKQNNPQLFSLLSQVKKELLPDQFQKVQSLLNKQHIELLSTTNTDKLSLEEKRNLLELVENNADALKKIINSLIISDHLLLTLSQLYRRQDQAALNLFNSLPIELIKRLISEISTSYDVDLALYFVNPLAQALMARSEKDPVRQELLTSLISALNNLVQIKPKKKFMIDKYLIDNILIPLVQTKDQTLYPVLLHFANLADEIKENSYAQKELNQTLKELQDPQLKKELEMLFIKNQKS